MSENTPEPDSSNDPQDPKPPPESKPDPKPTETVDFWKQKAREQEKRAKDNAEAAKRLQKIEDEQKSELERAVEKAKSEGRTEALTTANTRLVGAEARALAAEAGFRNPSLAVRAISDDLAGITVSDDGSVDGKAIKGALKALSDAEPYLVDTAPPARKPGELHSGASGPKTGGDSGKGRAAAALRDFRRGGS